MIKKTDKIYKKNNQIDNKFLYNFILVSID